MFLEEFYEQWVDSDLAYERKGTKDIPGVIYRKTEGEIPKTYVEVTTEQASKQIGRPRGRYITLTYPPLFQCKEEMGIRSLQDVLLPLLPNEKTGPLLVIGLGNKRITPDSLGPRTVDRILPKDHLISLAPGVKEDSGMEALEVALGVVGQMKPYAALCIDALCTRSITRLVNTIQISDTGIVPGSGIQKHKNALSQNTLGIPVIAIGVPTLMGTASLLYEALSAAGANEVPSFLLESMMDDRGYLCPKDIDLGIEEASWLLSRAIMGISCSTCQM